MIPAIYNCTWKYTIRCLYSPFMLQQAEDFVVSTMSRIRYCTDVLEAGKSCDLVVEAIVEDMAVKQELFAKLDKACPRSVVL